MALFRLDFEGGEPVQNSTGRDFICAHMQTARERAIQTAGITGRSVVITRIGKGGQLRPSLIARPDGSCAKPPGVKGETCTANQGRGACFCRNCRAARR